MVEANVDFLSDLNFQLVSIEVETWWHVSVMYSSDTSAIRFVRDFEADGCEVLLGRLVDGQVPPQPIWVSAEPVNWVPLDAVLETRAPELLEQVRRLRGVGNEDVTRQLRFWSEALQQVVRDFLDGDMACINEGAIVLTQRLEFETLTVSLPEDPSDDEMRRAIEEARATAPPGIRVVGQRYQR